MSLEDIVDITITASTASPTRPGFGTPLLVASKVPSNWGPNLVREFSKVSEMVDAGFTSADAAYVCASALFAQNPSPKKLKIGKRTAAPSQTTTLQCLTAVEGEKYTIEVGVGGGATTLVEFTVTALETTTTLVATAIEALIEAVTGVDSSPAGDTITVTPTTANTLVRFKNWNGNFKLTDTTADPGIANDLDDILVEDSDWYGLLLDSNSENEIMAAAAWTETNKKFLCAHNSDYRNKDANSTTDVMYEAKAAGYDRTFLIFNGNDTLGYSGAAAMGREFPHDPGKRTWAHKKLAGVTVDNLLGGERSAIEGKNGNHYTAVAGLNITRWGTMASGEYADTIRGIDWLESEIKIQVFGVLYNAPKVPYTDVGVGQIEGAIRACLRAGVRVGLLADDENLFVEVPKVADVDAVSRADRLLPNVTFGARLSGAIHKVQIDGVVSV